MRRLRHPLALFSLCFVVGTGVGLRFSRPPVGLAAALLAGGLAWRRRGGMVLAAVGAAWLNVGSRPVPLDAGLAPVDLSRPVTVVGEPERWTKGPFGWTARWSVVALRQGRQVTPGAGRVFVSLPEDVPVPGSGSLRAVGYLKATPALGNRPPQRRPAWSLRVKSARFVAAGTAAAPRPLSGLSRRLRRPLQDALDRQPPSPGRDLARALVLGQRDGLRVEVTRGLAAAGLSHLLAVSGLHLGILAGAAAYCARRLPGALRLLPVPAVLGAYLLAVGPQPALLRAAAMAALFCAALSLRRPPRPVSALCVAAALLVGVEPRAIEQFGFRLTVGATAGIVLLAEPLAARWTALPAWLARPLAVSATAQAAVLPFAVPVLARLHPAAAVLNLVAVPWTALSLVGTLVWTLAASVSDRLAAVLQPWVEVLAAPFGLLAGWPAGPWLTLPVALSPAAAWSLTAVVLCALWWPRWSAVLGASAVFCLMQSEARVRPPGPEAVMLDVGQGEAILLRDRRRAVLVDGGGWVEADIGGRELVPALASLGVSRLEALVSTHGDHDHCGGLLDLSAYLKVREVWAPAADRSPCALRLRALRGLRFVPLARGAVKRVGEWRLEVLHPGWARAAPGNDSSLVLLAEAHGRSFLLTGDLESEGERALLLGDRLPRRCCDVLKVGHHGSATSSTLPFLARLSPRLALISAGVGNRYGHPSTTVMRRLASRGVRSLRTDRDGQIRISIRADGSLEVTTPWAPKAAG